MAMMACPHCGKQVSDKARKMRPLWRSIDPGGEEALY